MHLSPDMCWWSLYFLDLGTIGGLFKFHLPQGLLIICVINVRGLKICLFAQTNPDILEHSSVEATIGEYAGRALAARYHVHHHQIPHVNSSPCQNGVHDDYLKVGDFISVFTSWQQDGADHVVKYYAGHGQAMG